MNNNDTTAVGLICHGCGCVTTAAASVWLNGQPYHQGCMPRYISAETHPVTHTTTPEHCPVCGKSDFEVFTAEDGELGTRAVSHIGCVRKLVEERREADAMLQIALDDLGASLLGPIPGAARATIIADLRNRSRERKVKP